MSEMNKLFVCGAGTGDPAQVTPEVSAAIAGARAVACAPRHLHLVREHGNIIEMTDFKECFAKLRKELALGDAAVVVSGDTGLYSLLPLIQKNFPGHEIAALPGISSLQALCAKACETWQDAVILSGHGRQIEAERILEAVEHNRSVVFFCDASHDPAWLCRLLSEGGFSDTEVFVGERLGAEEEVFSRGCASFLAESLFDPLSIVLVINEDFTKKTPPLPHDEDFIRGAAPMTREEVRAVIIEKMRLSPESVVWDIGAGTGSVSIAAAQLCRKVCAVEANSEAAELIRQNAQKFRLHNVTVTESTALAALSSLPRPDVVFIGGSGSELAAILEQIAALGGGIRVVVSAVALKTVAACTELLSASAFENFDGAQVAVSRIKTVGNTKIWSAQNPVVIFTAETAAEGGN